MFAELHLLHPLVFERRPSMSDTTAITSACLIYGAAAILVGSSVFASPKRLAPYPRVQLVLSWHWACPFVFYTATGILLAMDRHDVITTATNFCARRIGLEPIASLLDGDTARLLSLPLISIGLLYVLLADISKFTAASAFLRVVIEGGGIAFLVLASIIPSGCCIYGALSVLGAAWSLAHLRHTQVDQPKPKHPVISASIQLTESSSQAEHHVQIGVDSGDGVKDPAASAQADDLAKSDARDSAAATTAKLVPLAPFVALWNHLESSQLFGSLKDDLSNSVLRGAVHFEHAVVVNLFTEAVLVYVVVTQDIAWSVLNVVLLLWAFSTHAFLWASMFRKVVTWWGPVLGEFHASLEFATSVLTCAKLVQSDGGSTVADLIIVGVVMASFCCFLVFMAYKHGGFFVGGNDRLVSAYFAALILHYPGIILSAITACIMTAQANPGAYVIWIETLVWACHLLYEWTTLVMPNHEYMAVVGYGAQLCMSAVFLSYNSYF